MIGFGSTKLFLYLGAVLLLAGLVGGVYFKGFSDGKNKQAAAQAAAERESVIEGRAIEKEIMRLAKNEVQKRLVLKWCRDCS